MKTFDSDGCPIPKHMIERCSRCGCPAFMHSEPEYLCPTQSWDEIFDNCEVKITEEFKKTYLAIRDEFKKNYNPPTRK